VRLFSAMICSMDLGSLPASKLSSFRYIVFLRCFDDVLSECAVSDSESGTHIRKT
jgi:hypothetical protein